MKFANRSTVLSSVALAIAALSAGHALAADPADDVAAAHRVAQPLGRRGQDGVAGSVPVGIVHALEIIDIDDGDGRTGKAFVTVGDGTGSGLSSMTRLTLLLPFFLVGFVQA